MALTVPDPNIRHARLSASYKYVGKFDQHDEMRVADIAQLSNDASYEPEGNVNLGMANPSTPAQLFHLLRRQMVRNYRRPLIIASPKGLLRSPVSLYLTLFLKIRDVLTWVGRGVKFGKYGTWNLVPACIRH